MKDVESGTMKNWTPGSPEGKLILKALETLDEYVSKPVTRGRWATPIAEWPRFGALAEVAVEILGIAPSVEAFERVAKDVYESVPRGWWGQRSEMVSRQGILIVSFQVKLQELGETS